MALENNNDQQLKKFFNEEYHNLKAYVHSKIENDVDRDAEDIIQDVALKIFSRKSVLPINNVAGFVYHSIKNKIIDVLRKKSINSHIDDFESQLTHFADAFYENSEYTYSETLKEELKKAIFSLKSPYRDIVLAIDVEGYTYNEISKETGIPTGTLLSRRHRAISILHKKLRTQKNH